MAQLIVRIPISHVRPPEGYFVATNGRWGAAGTIFDPWSMDYAVSASSPLSDDGVLWMRGGTYTPLTAGTVGGATATNGSAVAGKGVYTLAVNASSGHPITIRNYPGEKVRINGAIHAVSGAASNITIQGLEIAATPTTRVFSTVSNVDYPGVYITAPGIKIVNNYIHDLAQVYIMSTGGSEFHGNICGWCGSYYSSSYNGYCIYTHNDGGGDVLIKKNCFVGGYNGYSVGCQSATNQDIRDYYIQYNVMLNGGYLYGNLNGAENSNNHFNYNYLFMPPGENTIMQSKAFVQGYDNTQGSGEGLEASYNYLCSNVYNSDSPGLQWYYAYVRNGNYHHNTIITNKSGASVGRTATYYAPTGTQPGLVINNNSYINNGAAAGAFWYSPLTSYMTFANWQSNSGYDADSTFSGTLPNANYSVVIDNDYDRRGFVAIYNWEGLSAVSVDLTSIGLTHGASCRYYNCANPSEYIDFNFNADNPITSFQMTDGIWTERAPTGHDTARSWYSKPFPDFGVFLVEQR